MRPDTVGVRYLAVDRSARRFGWSGEEGVSDVMQSGECLTIRVIEAESCVSWFIFGVICLRIVPHCSFNTLSLLTTFIGPPFRSCGIAP